LKKNPEFKGKFSGSTKRAFESNQLVLYKKKIKEDYVLDLYKKSLVLVSIQKFLIIKKNYFLKKFFMFKKTTFHFSKKLLTIFRIAEKFIKILISPFIGL